MEKRSLKNVTLTRKYHWPYFGRVISITLVLVFIVFGYHLIYLHTFAALDPDFPLQSLQMISTLMVVILSGLVISLGVMTAHRVAGPHIQLQTICDKIAAGDLSRRVEFRSGDRLEDVEESFNKMMDKLQQRLEGASLGDAPSIPSD